MKKLLSSGIFFILLLITCVNVSAQTKGLIYKKAAGAGQTVLDPNLDGYTSKTDQGFELNDEAESEIAYTPLPSLGAVEPDSDLGPGPSCGFTDLVRSDDNHTIYTYLDSNENLMFRFRLGGTAENSKAYSILIDTDQKFGSSGPNADPNYTPGNPGFEIEVVLRTNFGVGLYDVDGRTNALEIGTAETDRPYKEFAQKSIAKSEICGDDDYFYDFYIPFSDITAAFPSVTVSTRLRMVGNTVINPNESIGNNGVSDLGGADDNTGTIDSLWEQLIDVFPPTSGSEIGGGANLAPRAECPSITGSISSGATQVSGTSSEVDGAIIEVFRDGISIGTTTVSSGSWSLAISAAQVGEIYSATASVSAETATATGTTEKSPSYSGCNGTEVDVTCSTAPNVTGTENGSNKAFQGSVNFTGSYELRVYNSDGSLLNSPAGASNPATYSTTTWVWDYGTGSTKIPAGLYYFTVKEAGKCESPRTELCLNTTITSSTPVVSGTPILDTDTSISGTAGAGATVNLLINSEEQGSVTADAGGNWSFSVSGLENGDEILIRAIEAGACIAETSVIVNGKSTIPIIRGEYCTSSGPVSAIYGISSEIGGTIHIYTSSSSPVTVGTPVATATVASNGSWAASVNVSAGTFVAASVKNTDEIESDLSDEIQIYSQTIDTNLAITSNSIAEGDASISGTGTSGNIINLYLDGYIVDGYSTTVGSDGTWVISGLDEISAGYDVLYSGAETGVTAQEGALCESSIISGPIVSCKPPSVQGFTAVSSTEICEYEVISFEVDPTEDLIVYELVDQDGIAIGPAHLADGNPLNLETFPLSVADGVESVKVKAQRIGVSCELTFGPAISVIVNPLPEINVLNSSLQVCQGDTSVDLEYSLDANGPALEYNIDFDSSAETAGFKDISNNVNVDSPVSISVPSGIESGNYNAIFTLRNSENCLSREEAFTIQVFAPEITSIASTDPTICGGSDGSLLLKGLIPSENYDGLYFTDNGFSVSLGNFTSDSSGNYEITGLDAGSYQYFKLEYKGCISPAYSEAVILTDPGSASISYAGQTDPANCNSPDGEILLSGVTTGTFTVNYKYGGTSISQSITATASGIRIQGLAAGSYTNISVVNSSSCNSNTIPGPITLANSAEPTINLGSSPSEVSGTTITGLEYTGTTNNPDTYTINFNADAEAEGFSDVTNNLTTSPINIIVPSEAKSGTYYAKLVVSNSATGCISSPENFSVTITPKIPTVVSQTTDNNKPVIEGIWDESNANELSVTINSISYNLGSDSEITTDGSGNWNLDLGKLTTGLSDGTYEVEVFTRDAAGNIARDTSNDELVIDTTKDEDGDGVNADVDCNDLDNSIYPGAVEVPDDGIDQDCDGADLLTWYADTDKDGYGDAANTTTSNTQPAGYVSDSSDCDDSDKAINPETVWYKGVDADGDSYFGSKTSLVSCTNPGSDYSLTEPATDDCDDSDKAINPDAVWYIGIDNDGDGFIGSVDSTSQCASPGTGYSRISPAVTDCDDSDKDVTPDTVWYKGVDADGDSYFGSTTSIVSCTSPGAGYSLTEPVTDDCDDSDKAINPETVWYIGVDNDGDGFIGSVDSTTQCAFPGTGYSATSPAMTDCDDSNKDLAPDTVWYKGVDADGDTYFGSTTSVVSCASPGADYSLTEPATDDCDDSDKAINPDTVWYIGVDADGDGFFGSVDSITQCASPGTGYSNTSPAVTDCDDSDKNVTPDTVWYKGVDADGDGYFGSTTSVVSCTSPATDYSLTEPATDDCDDSDKAINPDTLWYIGVDNDGDGFIGSVDSTTQCVSPGTGYSRISPVVTDCDDSNKDLTPDTVWYKGVDADGDGYLGSTTSVISCTSPGSEYSL
ncbi:hypothetical protein FLP08_13890, partial [Gramella aestuarii]